MSPAWVCYYLALRHKRVSEKGSQEDMQASVLPLSPRKDLLSSAPAPRRGVSAQDHSKKTQSVTEDNLPRTHQHLKPVPQRRAVSVHEDTLAMTQELKTVLQRSPVRFRGNRYDLPSCNEDKAQRTDAGDIRKLSNEGKKDSGQLEDLKADRETRGFEGMLAETKHSLPEKEESPHSTHPQAQHDVTEPRTVTPKAPPTLERPPELTQTPGKSPGSFASNRRSCSTVPQTLTKLLVSPQGKLSTPTLGATKSTEIPPKSPLSPKKDSSAAVDGGQSTRETKLDEPAEHRAKSPSSE